MEQKKLVKFFIKGGILAPADLIKIVEVHDKLGGDYIQFGDRQEVIIRIKNNNTHLISSIAPTLHYEIADDHASFTQNNIISSFLSKKIDQSTYWVKQSSYLDILDHLQTQYKLRVNITDLKQDFVYSFTGDVNFIASDEVNYWYLYLRDKVKGNQFLLPFLIYSEDLPVVIEFLENNFNLEEVDFEKLSDQIKELVGFRGLEFSVEPRIKVSEFANFEGLHKYDEKYWLGIYTRDGRYNSYLLSSLAALCKAQMIGQVHITPWKTLIVKEIESSSVIDWKLFLSEHEINNGHSEAELNWQLKDLDEEALELKTFLRKEIAHNDININGAIFGVNMDIDYSFAHIFIEKRPILKFMGRNEMSTYNILYRENFNPSKSKFTSFKTNVFRSNLAKAIQQLVKEYHDKAYREVANFIPSKRENIEEIKDVILEEKRHYRCKNCYTVYYPEHGDEFVTPGTSFEDIPDTYCCSICDSPKSEFEEINLAIIS